MIHYSTKHEVKKTFKKIIWQQIGGWKMEMDASMRSFQNMGKILILEAYTISFIYTSQFLGCPSKSKSKYMNMLYHTTIYNKVFKNSYAKYQCDYLLEKNITSPKKFRLLVLNTRLKNKSYLGEVKIIWILKVYS